MAVDELLLIWTTVPARHTVVTRDIFELGYRLENPAEDAAVEEIVLMDPLKEVESAWNRRVWEWEADFMIGNGCWWMGTEIERRRKQNLVWDSNHASLQSSFILGPCFRWDEELGLVQTLFIGRFVGCSLSWTFSKIPLKPNFCSPWTCLDSKDLSHSSSQAHQTNQPVQPLHLSNHANTVVSQGSAAGKTNPNPRLVPRVSCSPGGSDVRGTHIAPSRPLPCSLATPPLSRVTRLRRVERWLAPSPVQRSHTHLLSQILSHPLCCTTPGPLRLIHTYCAAGLSFYSLFCCLQINWLPWIGPTVNEMKTCFPFLRRIFSVSFQFHFQPIAGRKCKFLFWTESQFSRKESSLGQELSTVPPDDAQTMSAIHVCTLYNSAKASQVYLNVFLE